MIKIKTIRTFETGATRDTEERKPDPEGFLSPLAIARFNEYMHKHRKQADGSMRASDNWQKGMPLDVYMKSGFRHFLDWWTRHRGWTSLPAYDTEAGNEDLEDALCALLFNVQAYLHEIIKAGME